MKKSELTGADLSWIATVLRGWGLPLSNIEKQRDAHRLSFEISSQIFVIDIDVQDSEIYEERSEGIVFWLPESEGFKSVIDAPVPLIDWGLVEGPIFHFDANKCHCRYDILRHFFISLVGAEEVGATDFDIHGRMPTSRFHSVRYGYENTPHVDLWFEILLQVVERMACIEITRKKHKRIEISVDVDRPALFSQIGFRRLLQIIGWTIFRKLDLVTALTLAKGFLLTRIYGVAADPYNTFSEIFQLATKASAPVHVFMKVAVSDEQFDERFDWQSSWGSKLIKEVIEYPCEIGLHPSYNAYSSATQLAREREDLHALLRSFGGNSAVDELRTHYLRWHPLECVSVWQSSGFKADHSQGFHDSIGFKRGTSKPYLHFDLSRNATSRVVCKPLLIMDQNVITALQLKGDSAIESIIEYTLAVGGTATVLWHNCTPIKHLKVLAQCLSWCRVDSRD